MDIQDNNEPNAWDDINPPMASVPQPEQRLRSSGLVPATNEEFRNELTACLVLVAPVGMTEEAKREWLAVAWGTLKHLPADLLTRGCRVARQTCDHPSKIVPAILKETEQSMIWRRDAARDDGYQAPRLAAPDVCTPEQAREILKEFGLKSNPLAPE